jgi:SAM-dependent methyltransferase
MGMIGQAMRRFRELLEAATRKRFVQYKGSLLPPPNLRLCSAKLQDDEYFLESAELEAERLVHRLGCRAGSSVLEIGCGSGRLPIGLLRQLQDIDYQGLDVLRPHIDWCTRYISRAHPSFCFSHLDAYSARYNPSGRPIAEGFRLPWPEDHFDIVYMYGVMTNMTDAHARIYLREMQRLVRPTGTVFLTGFVEDDVPAVSVNPDGYLGLKPAGPLFLVRYQRDHFLSMIADAHLKVGQVEKMGAEYFDSQTAFYLSKG